MAKMQRKLITVQEVLKQTVAAMKEHRGKPELSRIEFQVIGYAGAVMANAALMRTRATGRARQWNAYWKDKPGWVVICVCRETPEQGVLLREVLKLLDRIVATHLVA